MRNLKTLSPKSDVFIKSIHTPPQGSGNPAEEEAKECKSQRGWGTPRKQGALTQHDQSSCALRGWGRQLAQGLHRSGSCLCYTSRWLFCGLLSVWVDGSLCAFSLTLLPLSVLSNSKVPVFVLPYYIVLLSLEACLFSNETAREGRSWQKQRAGKL